MTLENLHYTEHHAMETTHKIDTHSHFLPDFYREALVEAGITKPDGMPAIPPWNEQDHLDFMSKAGISKSYLSISSPGVDFVNNRISKSLSRKCNEHASQVAKRNPGKFGSFASLPLPDVEAALAEVAYALDELGADGFVLYTSYGGIYPGDKKFDPLWEELNHRKAKVFFHPTTSCYCINGTSHLFKPLDIPSPLMEFFFDSARCVINLIISGMVSANPDITFLISHAGGVLPPLIDRLCGLSPMKIVQTSVDAEEIKDIFRNRFFYDLAGFSMENQIHGLLRWTGPSQLLYGSDYPFTPTQSVLSQIKVMDDKSQDIWGEEDVKKVYFGNAESLLGR
jgi:predicted TIM-barrel fold metal-dependent hydrolase